MVVSIGNLFNVEKGVLQSSKCTPGKFTFITAAEDWKTHKEYSHDCEALVFAAAASGSLGRTHYFKGKFISSDLCFILTPKNKRELPIDLKFYHFIFNNIRDKIVKATKTGTSKEAINIGNFSNYSLPYFDIKQQLIWKEKLTSLGQTVEEAVDVLEYQTTLLTKLRQSILQEAVQGKLIPQNPKDEPASVLLEKIKKEKAKLIAEGKLKKEKPLPPISKDEMPFELPKGWVWCRWDDVLSFHNYSMKRGPFGSSLKKEMFLSKGIRVFEQYNPINDDSYWARYYISNEQYKALEAFSAYPGDLLISCSGATLGRITKINDDAEWGIINQALLKLTLNENLISNTYFIKLFRSSYIQQQILEKASGSAIPNMVGVSELKKILIPLPPFPEQQRIVSKIEEIMKTCDSFEKEVQCQKEQVQALMQAVLREAFENGNAKGKTIKLHETTLS